MGCALIQKSGCISHERYYSTIVGIKLFKKKNQQSSCMFDSQLEPGQTGGCCTNVTSLSGLVDLETEWHGRCEMWYLLA